jgi:hypothetical protein
MSSPNRSTTVLLAIALGSAALTFGFFHDYPAFAKGHRDPPLAGLAAAALFILLLTAPVLWIAALVGRAAISLGALEAHAALFGVFLFVILLTNSPGHSSPGEAFGVAAFFVVWLILAVEGIVLAIAIAAMREPPPDPASLLALGPGLSAALFGGWVVGVLAWSSLLPPRVIAAAEAAAGDRPYCIDVDGRPARAAGDLDALSMRATNAQGWTFSFHALLVIGEGADRRYMNWSYRSGGFQPVSDHAREGLHLDKEARCRPAAHFARDW